MPVRLGHWQSQTSSFCSEMTGQWSDRSAMSGCKTLSLPGPMNYLGSLALRIWTSFWRREGSAGMDMWNTPMVQSRQPLTYRLMESVCLGGPRWHRSSRQRGIGDSGSSWLSILMTDIPGDLVWDLPCMQQASYLGLLMWMLTLYLHVNQKPDYDMMIYEQCFSTALPLQWKLVGSNCCKMYNADVYQGWNIMIRCLTSFNIIQVIWGQWRGDNERLCTMKSPYICELNSASTRIPT